MKKVLVICGHSDFEHSFANKEIMKELKKLIPDAKERILSELYTDGKIDIEAEQQALLEAEIIVFDYPVNWYDYPYLLKQYFDLVFLHNFAYGSVRKLEGKKLVLSFTTGAPAEAYTKEGAFHMPISDYLNPQRTSAELCGIKFCEPVVSYDMTYLPGIMDAARKALVEERAREHAKRLAEGLATL